MRQTKKEKKKAAAASEDFLVLIGYILSKITSFFSLLVDLYGLYNGKILKDLILD